jgi:membrane protease YdiL (CAAX protease family)
MAEEAFLRGALFDAVEEWAGPAVAVAVGAVCFAGLHVPLYGWASAPLDLAVGLLFGALRWVSGSWLAPGLAHTFADLAGWWLR